MWLECVLSVVSLDFKEAGEVSSSFMWERRLVVRHPERHNGKDPRAPVGVKTHLFIPTNEKADVLSGAHTAKNAATKATDRPTLHMSTIPHS